MELERSQQAEEQTLGVPLDERHTGTRMGRTLAEASRYAIVAEAPQLVVDRLATCLQAVGMDMNVVDKADWMQP